MKDLLSRLSGRKDEEIPTHSGFCIAQGFILDNNRRSKERVAFAYGNNDFNLYISTNNTLGKDESLLERSHEISPVLLLNKTITLRKGKRMLPSMDAEEWLLRGKQRQSADRSPVDMYDFVLNANEKFGDYEHPMVSATLTNEYIFSTQYSEAQLMDIWDRITSTLRPRPEAF